VRFGVFCANYGFLGEPRTVIDLALESEAAGWDGFFLYDHIMVIEGRAVRSVDPWTVLAVIGERTGLCFGPMITPVARRQPWELAHQTIALNRLSGGRLILGAGLGERTEFDAFGPWPAIPRGDRLDEGLDLLGRLWAGEIVTHEGGWQLHDAAIAPGPVSQIPIWVGGRYGTSPVPARRAARYQGFFPINRTWDLERMLAPSQFAEMVAAVGAHRDDFDGFDLVTAGLSRPGTADRQLLDAFAAAGATWWLEVIEPRRGALDELRERIRSGPPRGS
jgi:alkanesulfonate monooxygenase SsuD/methylene tetrahydromethanopterin reductase-like flavin-dependent oxidoreductase (luciferase family)